MCTCTRTLSGEPLALGDLAWDRLEIHVKRFHEGGGGEGDAIVCSLLGSWIRMPGSCVSRPEQDLTLRSGPKHRDS